MRLKEIEVCQPGVLEENNIRMSEKLKVINELKRWYERAKSMMAKFYKRVVDINSELHEIVVMTEERLSGNW